MNKPAYEVKPGHPDALFWDELITRLPGAHVLQTCEWGQVKQKFGWQPHFYIWLDQQNQITHLSASLSALSNQLDSIEKQKSVVAAAMLLQRIIPVKGFAAKMSILYIPKGPLLDWGNARLRRQVLEDLSAIARNLGGVFVKVDPDVQIGTGIPGAPDETPSALGTAVLADLQAAGWSFSNEQVQFRNTVLLDITRSEEEILSGMKPKTRYNIRLATRKGVIVRQSTAADLPMLYQMYAQTAIRDGFIIREENYYRTVWETFLRSQTLTNNARPYAEALVAEFSGKPVAALFLFCFAHKAWYLYGMSGETHRDKMPNYLLQWEAMRHAQMAGCNSYDLWGAPDEFSESDPLWGVYRFKEGLGGRLVRYIGAWDLPVRPTLYQLYTKTLPRLLDIMRKRGHEQTKRVIS